VFFDPVRYTCAQRSWDGNKGIGTMKRTLVASVALFGGITSAAMAADLPPPMAPPPRAPAAYIPVAPAYNWSGFYIGGNLGAGFSKGTFSDTFGSTFNSTNSNTSFLGGGQVGVNYEFYNGVVIGAEAMFDWAPNTNNTITATGLGTVPNNSGTASAQLNNRWLTTATGKLGYAWDRVLLYGKGGWAWVGQSNSNVTVTPTGLGTTATSLSSNSTNSGWTAGVGVECLRRKLVSASRIRLYWSAKSDLHRCIDCAGFRWRQYRHQQPLYTTSHRWLELQVRLRLGRWVVVRWW
jgi:outer membrane immunogenic protein